MNNELPLQVNMLTEHVFKVAVAKNEDGARKNASFVISSFSELEITTINTLNPVLTTNPLTGKQMRLDSLFEVNGDILVDIEVQQQKELYDPERLINYLTVMNQLLIQRDHSHTFGQCVLIYIADYRFSKDVNDELEAVFRFMNGTMISEKLKIIVIQLADLAYLLKKSVKEMTTKERLMLYFKYSHVESKQALIEELKKEEPKIMTMHNYVLSEQDAINYYFMRKQRTDEITYQRAYEKAEQEREKAEQERKMAEQKQKEEARLREKAEYTISLMNQGYTYEEAKEKAEQKYHKCSV